MEAERRRVDHRVALSRRAARERHEVSARRETLGLSEDKLAFDVALETDDRAVKILGDETLRGIAQELVRTVR